MKKTLILSALILSLCASVYCAVDSLVDTKHRYQIDYNHGKYSLSDYTDTFQVTDNSITYIDEKGVQVSRYGSFSIKNNVDYKK